MDRVAVFVDAGYLFAQGAGLRFGEKLPRGKLDLDYRVATTSLQRFAESVSGLKLLRTYWYDGTSTGPTSQHLALAYLDSVKVRLGFVNSNGEQKGVDSLIVTDMIALARNRAMADAVLLSGDEDLRVGVQQAQDLGVRVHLLGIKPSRGSQSSFLIQEADTTHEWDESVIAPFLNRRSATRTHDVPPTMQMVSSVPTEPAIAVDIEAVIHRVVAEIEESDIAAVADTLASTKMVPPEQDRALLARCRARIGRDLDSSEKKYARARFANLCQQRR
jgi:uncharacterized LabA/DUF88 family protein